MIAKGQRLRTVLNTLRRVREQLQSSIKNILLKIKVWLNSTWGIAVITVLVSLLIAYFFNLASEKSSRESEHRITSHIDKRAKETEERMILRAVQIAKVNFRRLESLYPGGHLVFFALAGDSSVFSLGNVDQIGDTRVDWKSAKIILEETDSTIVTFRLPDVYYSDVDVELTGNTVAMARRRGSRSLGMNFDVPSLKNRNLWTEIIDDSGDGLICAIGLGPNR